ncbi:hypothetical protein MPTK1_3g00680 [Marchantia polymorpha subsp. ruderalis]|uniref:Uncharacterized protein n=2 Tax=Marchantia polymorpha TaxID=3197 RepID=A0AAF6AVY8_MARPO|nr:hypothetical protein MARPO_0007s0064 [Marchantia polymorpha]BBN03922.1 hypothetical protein Mp_3g00680 [Marchantia polymorpha subsp. ruderalis]|eukprot:PTQ47610.1 hypothetical protein MARPO_0007s0064 [Marchantia polymorpha]
MSCESFESHVDVRGEGGRVRRKDCHTLLSNLYTVWVRKLRWLSTYIIASCTPSAIKIRSVRT